MTAPAGLRYTVEAYNLSHASENKIHDDAVAGKLGFAGGLVPGVEVYAYMTHVALEHFGIDFLGRGEIECRFAKPVYDGRKAHVSGTVDGDRLAITVESEGELCATGHAVLSAGGALPPKLADFPYEPPPNQRPPADEATLAPGNILCTEPEELTRAHLHDYLRDVRETDPRYTEQLIAHPGLLLRLCNAALRDNVVLAPWIHVGSRVQNLALAHVGDRLSARTKVTANTERKGHRFVDLDCLILANEKTPIAHVAHTAIYKLRQLAA
jgi:acyl dehydratase